ncbi:rhomboid family intramembrane serine protease [Enterococcus sp. JM4C]|uniref:rhomboid family intramembrane serine protease n=1 Tax=Candidatus Enterococcus huntleyi TaxID=1857217 RepID=UPI00137AC248|nr:rhomboid family intramembrane serine protease [Enterococcus sp. JM4C]KAF1296792.1 rhomboid family intramembrane serine protease [Enterococcus sp. JM4C]
MNYQQQMKLKRWLNKPFLTYAFLGIQTVVFLLMFLSPTLDQWFYANGTMYGPRVAFLHEYWRLITPMFIHFGLSHFALNSVVLYFMGSQIEAIYGHGRFFLLYLLSGIMGNMASFAFNGPTTVAAGSSTALFGMFGAFLILGVHFRDNATIQGMVRQFVLFVAMNLLFGVFDQTIDIWGHVGGIVGGLLLGSSIALPHNKERYSIHERIIAGGIYIFLLVVLFLMGLKKYGLI